MTNNQHGQVPEALRLAEEIRNLVCSSEAAAKIAAAADELCRLHVENASLRAQQPASPPADQQAAQVIIDFAQVGTAGPFPVVNGRVSLPDATMQDLVRMLRPTYEAEQAAPKAAPGEPPGIQALMCVISSLHSLRDTAHFSDEEGELTNDLCTLRDWAYAQTAAFQPSPKVAPGAGNSGFDHQTAADFLSGKTISDEAVRKFVAASRWAHDEKAALSATLLAMHGVLTSREAEIALLKQALLEAETAPQPAPAPLSDDTALLDGLARLNWYVGPGNFYCDEAGGMNDYDDKNSGPEELRQAIRAAIAAQGGKV